MKLKKLAAILFASALALVNSVPWMPQTPAEPVFAETQTSETAQAPYWYCDKITAKPGDKNIPFSIYVENNPGISSFGIRLYSNPAFQVVGTTDKETGKLTPKYKAGTPLETRIYRAATYVTETALIGFTATGVNTDITVADGAVVTFYVDIPEDTPEGTYPFFAEMDELIVTGSKKVTADCKTDGGYIRIGNEPESEDPEVYGSIVSAGCGSTHVPFSVKIKNNPGILGMGLQLEYVDTVKPVAVKDDIPECEFNPEIADPKVAPRTVFYAKKHTLAATWVNQTPCTSDGDLMTCYFDIPEHIPCGIYKMKINVDEAADKDGEPITDKITVKEGYLKIYEPPLQASISAPTVSVEPGKPVIFCYSLDKEDDSYAGITELECRLKVDEALGTNYSSSILYYFAETDVSYDDTYVYLTASNQTAVKKEGNIIRLVITVDKNTAPGYYPVDLYVDRIVDGRGMEISDRILVYNGYIQVGEPEGTQPAVTFITHPYTATTTTETTTTTATTSTATETTTVPTETTVPTVETTMTTTTVTEPEVPVIYGDLNGDKQIDARDLTLLKQDILSGTKKDLKAGDLDGDNKLTKKDAALMVQYLQNRITKFPRS